MRSAVELLNRDTGRGSAPSTVSVKDALRVTISRKGETDMSPTMAVAISKRTP